jgi:transcriptional regulator with XRE-family HTH domain
MNTTINPYPSYLVKPTSTHSSPTAIKLVAPLLILTAGTGGVMTAHSAAAALDRWVYYPRIHVEPSVAKQVDMRSPAEHVANIRNVLAISMSDLASVLGVTRPTAYAWLEGQEPKAEAVNHIQRLSLAADEIHHANIIRLDKLVHRPILNGRSLLDILKADEDPLEALSMLKEIAKKEAQTRCESKGSGKQLRSLDDVLSEISVSINEWS